jgi:SAM-dependent methyltransferase
MMELLLGAGRSREKKVVVPGRETWTNLVTLDLFDTHNPDVVWDIEQRPLPFPDNTFDEIHAYDVLEHLSQQGDWKGFFDEWCEWYRLLKPGGLVCALSPHWSSPWAWMDPGHRRVYGPEVLGFLDQSMYAAQVGVTPMTDYRSIYHADFEPVRLHLHENRQFEYVLRAIKPARIA